MSGSGSDARPDGLKDVDNVYLKPRATLEPLVCGWYAWTHLISPIQCAMNLAFRCVPLLQSFIKTPSIHVSAAKDPSLFGGPFVHLGLEDLPHVEQLLRSTTEKAHRAIQLARVLKKTDERLQASAQGFSLSEHYANIPQELAGLVEFVYDLNNHASVRVREELCYDEGLTEGCREVLLALVPEEQRRFFMSTPRVNQPDSLVIGNAFEDERLDALSAMRTQPAPLNQIIDMFNVGEAQVSTFKNFFTSTEPQRNSPRYRGDGVRVRYFGHACVLVQTSRVAILIDPMLAWDASKADGRFTFVDLPDQIDFMVLSHNHQDHCSPEMLIQLRHKVRHVIVPRNNAGSISDPSMKLVLQDLGFRSVRVVDPFDVIDLEEGRITSLPFPGEHVDLDIHSRHGIHIEIKGRRFAFLVDSDAMDPMLFRRIRERLTPGLDALFIGMECHGAPLTWLYGPLLTRQISRRDDESRRLSGLDAQRAWRVLEQFPADNVYVYAMGQEPWLQYIMGLRYTADSIQLQQCSAFLNQCNSAGVRAENLFISKDLEF